MFTDWHLKATISDCFLLTGSLQIAVPGGDREDVSAGPGQHRRAPARAAVGSRSNDTGHCGGCRVTAHGKPGAATKRVQTKIFCLILYLFLQTSGCSRDIYGSLSLDHGGLGVRAWYRNKS